MPLRKGRVCLALVRMTVHGGQTVDSALGHVGGQKRSGGVTEELEKEGWGHMMFLSHVYFGIGIGFPGGAKMAPRSPERTHKCGESWQEPFSDSYV